MPTYEADVLLVEDNRDIANLTVQTLYREKLAANVVIAKDGNEALDFIFCRGNYSDRSFDFPPKLVLLALPSRKVNRMEILKQAKADPRTKAIPVVILTSSKEECDLMDGYNLGANGYVQKPADFDQLRETVKTLGKYWMVLNQSPVANGKLAKGSGQS